MSVRRLVVSLSLALFGALAANACGASATGADACKTIESARCAKLASADCPTDPSFASQFGTAESCTSFYQVQCGRGLVDGARAPTTSELNACLTAIKADCAVASDPLSSPACAIFLAPVATFTPDAGSDAPPAETATDDTGIADTAVVDTGTITVTDTGAADAGDDTAADAPASD